MFLLHQTHNQAQNSTNITQTINSLHYHAANSRKCERKQERMKYQGFFNFLPPLYSQLHECPWRSCCRWELEIQHKANFDHHINRFCNGVHPVHQCRVYNGVHSCFSQAAGRGQQNYDMRLHSSTPSLGMNSGCFGTNVGIQVDTSLRKTVKMDVTQQQRLWLFVWWGT